MYSANNNAGMWQYNSQRNHHYQSYSHGYRQQTPTQNVCYQQDYYYRQQRHVNHYYSSSRRPTQHYNNVYSRDNRPRHQAAASGDGQGPGSVGSRDIQIRRLFLQRNIDLNQSQRLGSGKYSKVFTAMQINPNDSHDNKMLAMKIINTRKVTSDFTTKFLPREIECWKRLHHPNLVRILGHYTAFHYVFLTMEYAENGDMLRYVQKHGAVPEPQAKVWMKQIIGGVSYMHQKGIAHRDLKLENIVLFADNTVKVADFGFARPVGFHLSQTFCGSKSYSAPEILLGLPYDPLKADVWSIGIVAFIMITDRMPFSESHRNSKIIDQQRHRSYVYPKDLGIPSKIITTIDSILTYKPHRRPSIGECLSLPWFFLLE